MNMKRDYVNDKVSSKLFFVNDAEIGEKCSMIYLSDALRSRQNYTIRLVAPQKYFVYIFICYRRIKQCKYQYLTVLVEKAENKIYKIYMIFRQPHLKEFSSG